MYGRSQRCYNINVSTTSKDAKSLFYFRPKGRLGNGKLLLAAGSGNSRAVLFDGDKL
jgi:hypothetical protein